jgi:hypothetical protein
MCSASPVVMVAAVIGAVLAAAFGALLEVSLLLELHPARASADVSRTTAMARGYMVPPWW